MKLYYFPTPNSRKPCAVVKILDLPVEMVRVDITKGEHKAPEMLALNPNAKVPVLEDSGRSIWESTAIMMHLALKAGSGLWPDDPAGQVDVQKWLSWDAAHFSRHSSTLLFEHHVRGVFGLGDPDEKAIKEATGFFHQFAAVLDGHLKGREFVSGSALTLADISLSSMLTMSEQGRFPMDDCHEIQRWFAGLMEIPALANPWPTAG